MMDIRTEPSNSTIKSARDIPLYKTVNLENHLRLQVLRADSLSTSVLFTPPEASGIKYCNIFGYAKVKSTSGYWLYFIEQSIHESLVIKSTNAF